MTANQQEFQRQAELHCNTVNIVNTIINQNQEEVSSSSKIHEDNSEVFVTDKNETKAMEELFDKLVAEESTPGLDKLVRSRSFDAVEKWLQNSSSHQDQTAGKGKSPVVPFDEITSPCSYFGKNFNFCANSARSKTCDLSFASTETKYIKLKTKAQNNIGIFGFFLKNYIVILAFFEKNLTEI